MRVKIAVLDRCLLSVCHPKYDDKIQPPMTLRRTTTKIAVFLTQYCGGGDVNVIKTVLLLVTFCLCGSCVHESLRQSKAYVFVVDYVYVQNLLDSN
jgi:hypothetical protein